MASRTRQLMAMIPAVGLAVMAASGCATPVNQGAGNSGVPLVQSGKLVTCTHLSYKPFQFSEGDKTVGFDVKNGHVEYSVDRGAYNPAISDGETLFLTGYAGIAALRPRVKHAGGKGKGPAKRSKKSNRPGGKKKQKQG